MIVMALFTIYELRITNFQSVQNYQNYLSTQNTQSSGILILVMIYELTQIIYQAKSPEGAT